MEEEYIFKYTADQAVEDGYLYELGDISKEAGFKFTVRITPGVVKWIVPSDEAKEYGQDHDGRLWDVLYMARCEILKQKDERLIPFKVEFWAGLDFTSGPAIHIMLPSEY